MGFPPAFQEQANEILADDANAPDEGPKLVDAYRCCKCEKIVVAWRGACPACSKDNTLKATKIEEPVLARELRRERYRDPRPRDDRRFGGGGDSRFGGGGGSAFGGGGGSGTYDGRYGGGGAGAGEEPRRRGARGEEGGDDDEEGDDDDEHERPTATPVGAVPTEDYERLPTKIDELNKVLAGGPVKGTCICIAGAPGIGKSSILLQALAQYARRMRTLWATGEETKRDVSLRLKRFDMRDGRVLKNLLITQIEFLEDLLEMILEEDVKVIVVDSLQVMLSEELPNAPQGNAKLGVLIAKRLFQFAAEHGVIIFLICHVTKEGKMTGPNTIQHWVHANLMIECEGDPKKSPFRTISISKNRHGRTDVTGRVEMTEEGLVDAPIEIRAELDEEETERARPHRVARKQNRESRDDTRLAE